MMWSKALRALAWFHRWSGIVLCLLFALWFASGAVLSFVPFPALADDARTQASERINLASLRVSPSAAMARAGGGQALRLVAAGGRPVYLVAAAAGGLIPIAG